MTQPHATPNGTASTSAGRARRWQINRATVILILLSLLAGGFSAWSARGYIRDEIAAYRASLDARFEPVNVVVATQSVPPGSRLNNQLVATRAVPKEFLHQDAISAQEWSQLSSRLTRHPLTKGAPVLRSQLTGAEKRRFSDMIDEGQRAITFPVDAISALSGMLSPGDHVDILMTIRTGKNPETRPLMKNSLVVATGKQTDLQSTDSDRFNTITVMATPDEAARIVYAQEVGSLRVVLRGRADVGDQWPEKMNLARLLGQPEPKRLRRAKARNVDVIVGGRAGAGR